MPKVHIGMSSIHVHIVSCERIPDFYQAVSTTGGYAFAFGGLDHAEDVGGVAGVGVDVLLAGQSPLNTPIHKK